MSAGRLELVIHRWTSTEITVSIAVFGVAAAFLTQLYFRRRDRLRRLRVLVHRAVFLSDSGLPVSDEQLFVKVTNSSDSREVSITHIWLDTTPQIDLLNSARPLPARLQPDETFETWAPVAVLPNVAGLEQLVRVKLSNGTTVKSRLNKDVRPVGHVAGASYAAPLGTTEPAGVTGVAEARYVAPIRTIEQTAVTGAPPPGEQ
jgi:hypothetical protein